MRDDVALSFDGAEPFRGQRPRAPAGQMAGGQGPMGRNGASVLPFMPFDLGAPSSGNVAPPSGRLSYGGGSGNGFGAFEDELPLLEGVCVCNQLLFISLAASRVLCVCVCVCVSLSLSLFSYKFCPRHSYYQYPKCTQGRS
jgi:hypothetical protein